MACARNSAIIRNSVSLFPRERMRDITSKRLVSVKTSGTTQTSTISTISESVAMYLDAIRNWLRRLISGSVDALTRHAGRNNCLPRLQ
jgi:hypothetical protein